MSTVFYFRFQYFNNKTKKNTKLKHNKITKDKNEEINRKVK